jgi:hypothetical protein
MYSNIFIQQNYEIIIGFFSAYSMPQVIKQTASAIRAAGSGKMWKRRSPADLLFFLKSWRNCLQPYLLLSVQLIKRGSDPQRKIMYRMPGSLHDTRLIAAGTGAVPHGIFFPSS